MDRGRRFFMMGALALPLASQVTLAPPQPPEEWIVRAVGASDVVGSAIYFVTFRLVGEVAEVTQQLRKGGLVEIPPGARMIQIYEAPGPAGISVEVQRGT